MSTRVAHFSALTSVSATFHKNVCRNVFDIHVNNKVIISRPDSSLFSPRMVRRCYHCLRIINFEDSNRNWEGVV